MNLRVRYFALLRDAVGKTEESLDVDATTPSALYAVLSERYGLQLPQPQLRAAVNQTFVAWDHPLRDGDEVVFIPPVAGG